MTIHQAVGIVMLYRRLISLIPIVLFLALVPLSCVGCCPHYRPVTVIKVPTDDATLYPSVAATQPSGPILHCYNQGLRPYSHLMYNEALKRFKNPVVIDMHGGDIDGEWYVGWDKKIFGPRIRITQFAEQYLRKYKDCDIVLLACNAGHHTLILDVPPADAHRFWYFMNKVWIVPDDKIPYYDAWIDDFAPQLFFHETVRGEGDDGSIWEARTATAMGEVVPPYNAPSTQPTTAPCTQPCAK